ncbi:hypothetical protein GBA52_014125 [Prunus armeniaca]|nr:hypothetical protein GBA52_014125 [Prunus armeniaca]
MCQSQPRFGKMTSDQIGANGQYERNRTLEVSSVCQATQEPRHAHQLYPRQAAQNENLGDGNTIILEELNVETGFSWPHNRVNPRSDAKELEWDGGHMTRSNTLITNWTRASPKERSSRLDLGLIGYPVQKHGHGHTLNLEEVEDITKEATIGKGKKRVEGSQRRRFIKAKKTTQGESNKPKGVRGRTRGLFENANLIEGIIVKLHKLGGLLLPLLLPKSMSKLLGIMALVVRGLALLSATLKGVLGGQNLSLSMWRLHWMQRQLLFWRDANLQKNKISLRYALSLTLWS